MAAARDMQRRAALPRQESRQESGNREQGTGKRNSWGPQQQFQFYAPPYSPPPPPPPPPRSSFQQFQPLHHRRPSQQARQNASYGRIRPQMHDPPQNIWQNPSPHQSGTSHQRSGFQQRRKGPTKSRSVQEPPPSPPTMPPLSELFSMLGGLGGLGSLGSAGNAPEPPPMQAAFESMSGDGMDAILMMVLLLLLRKENADQGLLLALMYIML